MLVYGIPRRHEESVRRQSRLPAAHLSKPNARLPSWIDRVEGGVGPPPPTPPEMRATHPAVHQVVPRLRALPLDPTHLAEPATKPAIDPLELEEVSAGPKRRCT